MQESPLHTETLAAPSRARGEELPPLGAIRGWLPLGLLIILEAMAIGQLTAVSDLKLSGFGALGAGIILVLGLIPAALRASHTSTTFGCFCVALSCLVYLTPQITLLGLPHLSETMRDGPRVLLLANWLLIAMLGQQVAISFTGLGRLSRKASAAAFAVAGLSLTSVVLLPAGVGQMLALVVLSAFVMVLMAITIWLFARAGRLSISHTSPAAPAARLVIVSVALAEVPLVAMVIGPKLGLPIPNELVLGSQALIPLGVGAAILWRNPFGIDMMVRRAIAFSGVAVATLLVHLTLALVLIGVLAEVPASFRNLAVIAALLIGGVLYAPLRHFTTNGLRRLLFPELALVQREVASVREALAEVVRRDGIVALLTEEMPRRIDAAWGLIAPVGAPPPRLPGVERAWSMELAVGAKRLGTYWLGPRIYCPRYSAAEQAQLRYLGQQAALALAYAETVDALTALNRELEDRVQHRTVQVVAQQREMAANQERQRIARDLHDSVKQSLFSLGLGLRAVRGLLASDPGAAMGALREQEQVAMQAQREMAELLAQLRAHTVVGDLAEALRRHAALVEQQTGLRVGVEAPAALSVSGAEGGELLQIAREALHNVVKHSGASSARICLAPAPGALMLTISDDGRGFDAERVSHSGLGLRGMAERAATVGGVLAIDSAPGRGTSIRLSVPLEEIARG